MSDQLHEKRAPGLLHAIYPRVECDRIEILPVESVADSGANIEVSRKIPRAQCKIGQTDGVERGAGERSPGTVILKPVADEELPPDRHCCPKLCLVVRGVRDRPIRQA